MKKSSGKNFFRAGCLAIVLTLLLSTPGLATSSYLTYAGIIRDGIDGLDGSFALAASPDGANVYIAAFQDNGLSVYSRDDVTGDLTFLEFFQDGVGGVTAGALNWPSAVTVSQDGKNVYVASTGGNALSVFDRDGETGRLTFREIHKPGMNLAGASWVTLSPDGRSVYVASTGTKMARKGTVARFTRNLTTGGLIFLNAYADGALSGGKLIDGLFGASSVVVSPDGTNLYVSSSRDRTGAGDTSVVSFSRSPATGVLTFTQVLSNTDSLYSVSALTISPDGEFVYAGIAGDGMDNGTRAGALAVFQRTVPTGTLTLTNVYTDDVGTVTGLDKILAITLSHDGDHLYAAAKEDDALTLFDRDETSGALTFAGIYKDETNGIDGLDAVKGVIVSPDGRHVYAVGEYEDAVATFGRHSNGTLDFLRFKRGSLTSGVNGLNGASGVSVSPDGKQIYATGMYDGAIAVFNRDAMTGGMDFLQFLRDDTGEVEGLAGAYAVTTSPDGKNVYVAAYYKNSMVTFSRNVNDGTLAFMNYLENGVDGVAGLHGANSVEVSPDGRQVYVASQYDNAIATFNRDADTGALTYADMVQDGVDGVDGLTAVRNTTISSDGKFLYAAGFTDNVVSVFSRMIPTGTLTFTSVYTAPLNAAGGPLLGGINSVALSPDGKSLYTADMPAKSVVAFDRNPDSGALTFVEAYQDHSLTGGTIDGLDGANAVAVSPDGTHVYVTTQVDNSLVVFNRDAATGKLTFVEVFKDGVGGIDGLYTPMAVTTSPEGYQVYVVSKNDDSLAAFNIPASVNISGPQSGVVLADYKFTAAAGPLLASTPVTYTWAVDGALPITHTVGLTDTLTVSWSLPGTHTVAVTASTPAGLVISDTQSIDIFVKVYMPIIGK